MWFTLDESKDLNLCIELKFNMKAYFYYAGL